MYSLKLVLKQALLLFGGNATLMWYPAFRKRCCTSHNQNDKIPKIEQSVVLEMTQVLAP